MSSIVVNCTVYNRSTSCSVRIAAKTGVFNIWCTYRPLSQCLSGWCIDLKALARYPVGAVNFFHIVIQSNSLQLLKAITFGFLVATKDEHCRERYNDCRPIEIVSILRYTLTLPLIYTWHAQCQRQTNSQSVLNSKPYVNGNANWNMSFTYLKPKWSFWVMSRKTERWALYQTEAFDKRYLVCNSQDCSSKKNVLTIQKQRRLTAKKAKLP